MRTKTAEWFECRVKYEVVKENGTLKRVVEQFAVEASSFGEAESRITESILPYTQGYLEVAAVKKASYSEVFLSDVEAEGRFFLAKIDLIGFDEKTGEEKRSRVTRLVWASDAKDAFMAVTEVMKGTMIDYETSSIVETKLARLLERDNGGC